MIVPHSAHKNPVLYAKFHIDGRVPVKTPPHSQEKFGKYRFLGGKKRNELFYTLFCRSSRFRSLISDAFVIARDTFLKFFVDEAVRIGKN